jgi:hypothetical protein
MSAVDLTQQVLKPGEGTPMSSSGGQKIKTFTQVAPGATASAHWNNASAEVYSLSAWPIVSAGGIGQVEVTKVTYKAIKEHDKPTARELHFSVKNTGLFSVNIDVWAFWWNE